MYRENRDKQVECKKYTEDNKEKLQQKAKDKYAENRERLTATHICAVSGSPYTLNGKREHIKTLKHQKAVSQHAEQTTT